MKKIYVVYNRKIDRLLASNQTAFGSVGSAKCALTHQFKGYGKYHQEGMCEDYEVIEVEIK